MSDTASTLSNTDVKALLSDPSAENRANTAAKIAARFGDELGGKERALAEEIFRIMVKDAEVRVREALAQNLKENPNVPHDVAVTLANDVSEVALPMLEFSDVLTDADLLTIVNSQDETKQVAIAHRESVSESVSEALVASHNEEVVTTLVKNEGAAISETSLQNVVEEFGENEVLQEAMVMRPKLPVTVSERLVTMVSEQLQAELVKRQDLQPGLATDLILQSRERATITLGGEGSEVELAQLIRQLSENDRLTPSIMIRAVCMGDMDFFEHAMAAKLGIGIVSIRQLIYDKGSLGLKGAFEKAGLPMSAYPAVRAAIDVANENQLDGGEQDRERYARRMLERILTQYGDLGVEFESDDLEYLLAKMAELPAGRLDAA
ncbi:MAG: DUF2336 domain-containing protein [Magnetovibrionaceae bacterium]